MTHPSHSFMFPPPYWGDMDALFAAGLNRRWIRGAL